MEQPIEGIVTTLTSPAAGKNIVILAGVHGDEPCGIAAFKRIIPTLSIQRGTVTFVLGNPRAIEKQVRYTETNLNRMFRPDIKLPKSVKTTYEYRRSRELMPLLNAADAVLDVHSSGTKDTIPFAICGTRSRDTAQMLGFPVVSYGWDTIEPGGTDDYAERFGAEGICIECGYHEEPEAVDRAVAGIYRFLVAQGAVDSPLEENSTDAKNVRVVSIYKSRTNFVPERIFRDFEPVTKGTLIGIDGIEPVYAPDDGVVVFVRTRSGSGEEVFIFGRYEHFLS